MANIPQRHCLEPECHGNPEFRFLSQTTPAIHNDTHWACSEHLAKYVKQLTATIQEYDPDDYLVVLVD